MTATWDTFRALIGDLRPELEGRQAMLAGELDEIEERLDQLARVESIVAPSEPEPSREPSQDSEGAETPSTADAEFLLWARSFRKAPSVHKRFEDRLDAEREAARLVRDPAIIRVWVEHNGEVLWSGGEPSDEVDLAEDEEIDPGAAATVANARKRMEKATAGLPLDLSSRPIRERIEQALKEGPKTSRELQRLTAASQPTVDKCLRDELAAEGKAEHDGGIPRVWSLSGQAKGQARGSDSSTSSGAKEEPPTKAPTKREAQSRELVGRLVSVLDDDDDDEIVVGSFVLDRVMEVLHDAVRHDARRTLAPEEIRNRAAQSGPGIARDVMPRALHQLRKQGKVLEREDGWVLA